MSFPLLVALIAPVAGATEPCAVSRTTTDLDLALNAAESAFQRRQKDALVTAERDVVAVIPCLRDAVSIPYAARVHRVEGFTAFVLQDNARAQASFSSARAAEPAYLLPSSVVPSGHPMRALYDSASMLPISVEELSPIAGVVYIDGRVATVRPLDRPAIIQHFSTAGGITLSALIAPGEPTPALPRPVLSVVLEPAVAETLPSGANSHVDSAQDVETKPPHRKGPPVGVLAGVGAGAGVAVALYAAALFVRSDYDNLETTDANLEEIKSLYAANHGLVIASGVTGGLSLAAGITAFTVRW